jgi:hypothetical protein
MFSVRLPHVKARDGSPEPMWPGSSAAFYVGLLSYVASFFLIAVVGTGPARGYVCAFLALALPIDSLLRGIYFSNSVLEFLSVLISGCINPIFLLAAFAFLRQCRSVGAILRVIVLAMMPFCWISFAWERFYPREGYLLWTAGMVLVLFSDRFARAPDRNYPSLRIA